MRPMDLQIQLMTAADWPAVRAIYEEGIATGICESESSMLFLLPLWYCLGAAPPL
jgi:hypothetical protein